jgi:carboxylesterase 2
LYLNVYAPAEGAGKSVMFWIYGGDLEFGTAGQYLFDGSSIASNQDVVVVSANYRTNGNLFSPKLYNTRS